MHKNITIEQLNAQYKITIYECGAHGWRIIDIKQSSDASIRMIDITHKFLYTTQYGYCFLSSTGELWDYRSALGEFESVYDFKKDSDLDFELITQLLDDGLHYDEIWVLFSL